MRARVLIADDDPFIVQLLSEICTAEDFDIAVVSDGERVVDTALEQAPDLILLDLMMPGRNGFQVVEELRERPDTRAIPVILVTAVSDHDSIRKGYQLGANDYIVKPFRVGELVSRLRTHIDASAFKQLPGTARLWQRGGEEELRAELATLLGGPEGREFSLVLARVTGLEALRSGEAPGAVRRGLRALADRLRLQVRLVDQVFVLPEERIALLLQDTPRSGAEALCRRVTPLFDEPLTLDEQTVPVSSVWTVVSASSGAGEPQPSTLLQNALDQLAAAKN